MLPRILTSMVFLAFATAAVAPPTLSVPLVNHGDAAFGTLAQGKVDTSKENNPFDDGFVAPVECDKDHAATIGFTPSSAKDVVEFRYRPTRDPDTGTWTWDAETLTALAPVHTIAYSFHYSLCDLPAPWELEGVSVASLVTYELGDAAVRS